MSLAGFKIAHPNSPPVSKSKKVRVIIRTRQTSEFAQEIIQFGNDKKSIHIHIPKGTEGGYINNQQENWDFKFDNILHNASQENVYDDCGSPIIKGLLEGYNGTILAYGQTGAGKTFTMTGASENYKHRGLIPRAISHIFREISDRPQLSFTVRVSYLEIYNENMGDLLAAGSPVLLGQENELTVVDDKNGTSYVKGLTMQVTNSEEEALNHLFEGETNRAIAEHQLNKNSTRSHCIFTVYIESRSRVESSEKVMYSKLNLVDLAGSERLSKTQTSGTSLREAMHINKSLTFLEQVIIALADKKRDHIPYRQSKLTNVLRDALGGNCNTLMIANVWGERDHMEETISTLRFSTRMMCVMNSPEINVQYDPLALIKKYEQQIKELKQELAMHDTLSNRSHVQYEPFSETQRFELQKLVKVYIDNEEEEIEIISLRQIKEIFHQFRILYKNLEAEVDESRNSKIPANNSLGSERGSKILDNESGMNDMKDDGVGDTEGSGFGIGLAAKGGPKAGRDRRGSRKGQRIPTQQSGAHMLALNENIDDMGIAESPIYDRDAASSPSNVNDIWPQLPPLPNQAHYKNRLAPPPSRSDEFENFKRGKGAEMNRILTDNKATLKDKKRLAKESAETVNELKKQIDNLKDKIARKKYERNGVNDDENVIIDEEEYSYLNTLKLNKQQYREQFDLLRQTRSDIEYCTRLVDQCRQKLMSEFEQWYESLYGAQMTDVDGVNGQVEDVMDIGEKFDRLQMERMSQEDPDSLPYYNAKKNIERRITKSKSGFDVPVINTMKIVKKKIPNTSISPTPFKGISGRMK